MIAVADILRTATDRELLDDDLVECLLAAGTRALAYVGTSSASELLADARRLDALRGCLLVMGGAAAEVSEALRNWLPTVPWTDLADLGHWRLHGPLPTSASVDAVCSYIRSILPAALDELRAFNTPRTS